MCMPVLRFLTFSQWNHIEYTTLPKKTQKQKTKLKKKKETKQDKAKENSHKNKINEKIN